MFALIGIAFASFAVLGALGVHVAALRKPVGEGTRGRVKLVLSLLLSVGAMAGFLVDLSNGFPVYPHVGVLLVALMTTTAVARSALLLLPISLAYLGAHAHAYDLLAFDKESSGTYVDVYRVQAVASGPGPALEMRGWGRVIVTASRVFPLMSWAEPPPEVRVSIDVWRRPGDATAYRARNLTAATDGGAPKPLGLQKASSVNDDPLPELRGDLQGKQGPTLVVRVPTAGRRTVLELDLVFERPLGELPYHVTVALDRRRDYRFGAGREWD